MSDDAQSEPAEEATPVRDDKGRFLPGVSGNPLGAGGGRPKGSGMMAEIERQLALEAPDGRTNQEHIVTKLIDMAVEGDMRAAELILKRVAPERLALESDGIPLVLFRSFTGLGLDAPVWPALPAPALSEAPEDAVPDDAERLPDGRARFRI